MATASSEVTTMDNAPPAPPPVKTKSAARPYVILAAVVAVALLGYLTFTMLTRGKENTDDAQVEADVVPLSARVSAVVAKVHVTDNQLVKKGDLLVELDTADLEAKVKEREAELLAARAQADAATAQVQIVQASSKGGLAAAKAQLSGSSSSVASANAQIDAAKAGLARAQAEAARADQDAERAAALRKDDAIPQAQLDTARANADAAHASVAQAKAQLAVAQDFSATARTRVAEAQGHVEQSAPIDAQVAAVKAMAAVADARVGSATAALQEAKLQLSYARIEAPMDGSLSKVAVHVGQLVQPSQQLVSMVPSSTYVIANFKETQVGAMRPGQTVEIEIDAYPGRHFEGTVDSRSPATGARFSLLPPDNASGNFVKVVQRVPVKITWKNLPTDVAVAAGMSADVTVYTRGAK